MYQQGCWTWKYITEAGVFFLPFILKRREPYIFLFWFDYRNINSSLLRAWKSWNELTSAYLARLFSVSESIVGTSFVRFNTSGKVWLIQLKIPKHGKLVDFSVSNQKEEKYGWRFVMLKASKKGTSDVFTGCYIDELNIVVKVR